MNINKKCSLFLRDIFLYDISSCHYEILKRLNIDVSHIDSSNKLKRNTQIGLMFREKPRLTNIVRNITISTISEYLHRNQIKDDDIIIRQYDGLITTRMLTETDKYLPLDFRTIYQSFIISSDRTKYIAFNGHEVDIKGVPYRYPKMDNFLNQLAKINFANKESIFLSLEKIKNSILKSNDAELFCIPTSEDKFNIILKKYGETEISKNTIKILDTDDIDKNIYFNIYIRPFTESIIIEFV